MSGEAHGPARARFPGLGPGLLLSVGAPLATVLAARVILGSAHIGMLAFWALVGIVGHVFAAHRTQGREGARQWMVWVMAIGMPCLIPAFLAGGRMRLGIVVFVIPAIAGWSLFLGAVLSALSMVLSEWTLARPAAVAAGLAAACSGASALGYLGFLSSTDAASALIFWSFLAPGLPLGGLLLHVDRRRRLEAGATRQATSSRALQREAALSDRILALRRAHGLSGESPARGRSDPRIDGPASDAPDREAPRTPRPGGRGPADRAPGDR